MRYISLFIKILDFMKLLFTPMIYTTLDKHTNAIIEYFKQTKCWSTMWLKLMFDVSLNKIIFHLTLYILLAVWNSKSSKLFFKQYFLLLYILVRAVKQNQSSKKNQER